MSKKRLQRIRRELFEKDPNCHWCGRLTRAEYAPRQNKGGSSSDIATLDHLISRLDGLERWADPAPDKPRYVLSCRKCNSEREREKALEFSKVSGGLKATEFYLALIHAWYKVMVLKELR